MEFLPIEIQGAYIVKLHKHEDDRGAFIKTFHKNMFLRNSCDFELRESYFSNSEEGVIRGMHFQTPPHDHEKIVYPVQGKLTDVLLDIRVGSPTYGKAIGLELDAAKPSAVFIPKGIAHGFTPREGNCILVYSTSTEYDEDADRGIRFDSFDFNWGVSTPLLSPRDRSFPPLEEFDSPFKFTAE